MQPKPQRLRRQRELIEPRQLCRAMQHRNERSALGRFHFAIRDAVHSEHHAVPIQQRDRLRDDFFETESSLSFQQRLADDRTHFHRACERREPMRQDRQQARGRSSVAVSLLDQFVAQRLLSKLFELGHSLDVREQLTQQPRQLTRDQQPSIRSQLARQRLGQIRRQLERSNQH